MESLRDITIVKNLFCHLRGCFDRHKLDLGKLVSITTDGAPFSTGKKVNDKANGMYPARKVISLHCIILPGELMYEVHSISFQTFLVWTLLLTVHTKNSSPLQSILL